MEKLRQATQYINYAYYPYGWQNFAITGPMSGSIVCGIWRMLRNKIGRVQIRRKQLNGGTTKELSGTLIVSLILCKSHI